jgi:hypothetical protein
LTIQLKKHILLLKEVIMMDKRLERLKKGYTSLNDRERAYILGLSRALAAALRQGGAGPAHDGKKETRGRAGRRQT